MITFPLSIQAINEMPDDMFLAAFGDVAEQSPWVAEAATKARPYADRREMIGAFIDAVLEAEEPQRLALVRAHPDLAGRAKIDDLAPESRKEQRGAGLDQLTADEMDRFTRLNAAYRSAFGFPFIYAVKGADKHDILSAFEARLLNDAEHELAMAIRQIGNIIRFRLEDRVLE